MPRGSHIGTEVVACTGSNGPVNGGVLMAGEVRIRRRGRWRSWCSPQRGLGAKGSLGGEVRGGGEMLLMVVRAFW